MKIINKILKVFFILMLIFICYQFSYTYASNEYISNENLTYKELSDGTTLLSGFEIGTKVSEIINGYFSSEYTIKLFDDSGNDITIQNDKVIGTGCTVKLYTSSDEIAKTYTIVVYGDTNSDGSINAVDALIVVKSKIEQISFKNSANEEAGRINEDARKNGDIPSSVDALSIVKYKINPEQYPINQKLYNGIYVSLYDDGTLAFTSTNRVLEEKKLVKSYGDVYDDYYNYNLLPPWFEYREQILKVDFIDEIKPKYTSFWFRSCKKINIIENIKNLNTANVTDMHSMFENCSNLTNLNLSNLNTSNVISMKTMFYGCSNLTDLDLSNFDTSKITNVEAMFDYCSNLINIDLSNFDTSNITNMDLMFNGCTNLTSLNLSNFNTSNVTSMEVMFGDCENLVSLDLSNFDTSNVINMNNMFRGCKSLTNINISNFNTSNVTDMNRMFNGCKSLTNINISNFDTSNVTDMKYMFRNCSSLISLNVSNFTTSNVNNMELMFDNCSNLINLDLSNFDTSNVTNMWGMFRQCSNLINIYVGNKWTTENADTTDIFKNCSTDHVTVKQN